MRSFGGLRRCLALKCGLLWRAVDIGCFTTQERGNEQGPTVHSSKKIGLGFTETSRICRASNINSPVQRLTGPVTFLSLSACCIGHVVAPPLPLLLDKLLLFVNVL